MRYPPHLQGVFHSDASCWILFACCRVAGSLGIAHAHDASCPVAAVSAELHLHLHIINFDTVDVDLQTVSLTLLLAGQVLNGRCDFRFTITLNS